MFAPLAKTLVPTIVAAIALGAGAAGATSGWATDAIVRGAGAGLLVALAVTVHVSARTLAQRTPEARGAEFRDGSIEHAVIEKAAGSAFFDTVSLAAVASVVGLFAPAIAVYLLAAVAVFAIADFLVRASRAWRGLTVGG
ncbi:hypothetical protein [Frigoribacterium faeni]|uniref:hypothetical protein n=1 Tax=Frigoribacterium faeni TaxID=145483 RepID=UPI00141B691F|nr:hypothetical protein [Frigoribacterium faeni]NIJ05471.1 hypothetical protein [Frigoribacterium faeni]